eukprot:scaffold1221_cov207-Amphora_coffeaeformis.AAC.21
MTFFVEVGRMGINGCFVVWLTVDRCFFDKRKSFCDGKQPTRAYICTAFLGRVLPPLLLSHRTVWLLRKPAGQDEERVTSNHHKPT